MSTINLNDFYFPINDKIEVPEDSFNALMKTTPEALRDHSQLQFLYNQVSNRFKSALRVRHFSMVEAKKIKDLVEKDVTIFKTDFTYRKAVKNIIETHEILFKKLSERGIAYPAELQEIEKIKTALQHPPQLTLSDETKNYLKIAHKIDPNSNIEADIQKLFVADPNFIYSASMNQPLEVLLIQTKLKEILHSYSLSNLTEKDVKKSIKRLRVQCNASDTKTSESNRLVETSNLLKKLHDWEPKNGVKGNVWSDKDIDTHIDFIKLQKDPREHSFYDRLKPEFKKFDLMSEKRDKLMLWIIIVALYQVADPKIADFLTGTEAFTSMNGIVHAYLGNVQDDTISTEELLPETRKIFDAWSSQGSNTPKSSDSERRISMLPTSPLSPEPEYSMWMNQKLAEDL